MKISLFLYFAPGKQGVEGITRKINLLLFDPQLSRIILPTASLIKFSNVKFPTILRLFPLHIGYFHDILQMNIS